MKVKVIFSAFFLSILLSACNSTYNVIPINNNDYEESSEGIYYSLPRSVIVAEVTVVRTEKIKGPFAEQASKYLGLTNVIDQNSISYEVKDIKFSLTAEPDPNQVYYIELPKNFKNFNDLNLCLSEAGLLYNVNDNSQNQANSNISQQNNQAKDTYRESFSYFAEDNVYERVDTIFETVNMDTVTIQRAILKRSMVEKSKQEKAQDAANYLTMIKEGRMNLITGFQEVAYDMATIKYMDEQLAQLEDEYLNLFTGITFTDELTYRFTYTPPANQEYIKEPLFRFSDKEGIIDTSNWKGDVYYLEIIRTGRIDQLSSFVTAKETNKNSNDENGLYYRIPEYAQISAIKGSKRRADGVFLIAQYGLVTYLPNNVISVSFSPNTGSIKEINIGEK